MCALLFWSTKASVFVVWFGWFGKLDYLVLLSYEDIVHVRVDISWMYF